jgi:hypothetical protein
VPSVAVIARTRCCDPHNAADNLKILISGVLKYVAMNEPHKMNA